MMDLASGVKFLITKHFTDIETFNTKLKLFHFDKFQMDIRFVSGTLRNSKALLKSVIQDCPVSFVKKLNSDLILTLRVPQDSMPKVSLG